MPSTTRCVLAAALLAPAWALGQPAGQPATPAPPTHPALPESPALPASPARPASPPPPAATPAGPPLVASATIDNADLAVDPATTSIRITFDRPMRTDRFSVCGGGPTFPVSGSPSWADDRTLVLPVTLKPGSTYSFSLNCPSAQNLHSASGEPLRPYPISFSTRKPTDPTPRLTDALRTSGLSALRTAIFSRYSHRDLKGVDWDRRLTDMAPRFAAATTPSAFARAVAETLRPANDLHASVSVGPFTLQTASRSVQPNLIESRLTSRLQSPATSKAGIVTGLLTTSAAAAPIPYIRIPSWAVTPAELEPALTFLRQHAKAPGIVIDVRPNAGGDESVARRFASCFVAAPAVYARHRTVDPSAPGGFAPAAERRITPADAPVRFTGQVAVLMGPANMSSCESFLWMIRAGVPSPRSRLFGERSFGSSGNPKPHDLGNGVTVVLPSWIDQDPDGNPIEGRGIEPDQNVPGGADASLPEDPVLAAALSWLPVGPAQSPSLPGLPLPDAPPMPVPVPAPVPTPTPPVIPPLPTNPR